MNKIIALDLDGTTLNLDGKILTNVRRALEQAKKEGHRICFVTGRSEAELFMLDERCLADYLIVSNGSKVIRQMDKIVIAEKYLPRKEAIDVIEFCKNQKLLLYLAQGKMLYANRMNDRMQSYARYIKRKIYTLDRLQPNRLSAVESMTIMDGGCIAQDYLKMRETVFRSVASEDGSVDIMNLGVDKWKGIQIVLKELGGEAKQVVAVGNYDNDYEMVKNAGIGVAVANAKKELKEVADYVTINDHNHGAVAEAIFRFVLKKHNL